jgi:hypothetical protein
MSTAIWTFLAVMGMAALFAACVLAVVVGLRVLENVLGRRSRQPSASIEPQ